MQKLAILILSLAMTACIKHDFTGKTTYQGNQVSQEKLSQVRLGMSKLQVANVMGSTLISPTFSADRWDYVDTIHKANTKTKVKAYSFYFKHGQLVKIDKQA